MRYSMALKLLTLVSFVHARPAYLRKDGHRTSSLSALLSVQLILQAVGSSENDGSWRLLSVLVFTIQGWANALQLTTSISHTIAQRIAPNVLICPAADVKICSGTDAAVELPSGCRQRYGSYARVPSFHMLADRSHFDGLHAEPRLKHRARSPNAWPDATARCH